MRFTGEDNRLRPGKLLLVSILLFTAAARLLWATDPPPCALSNDEAFFITSITDDTNGTTLAWQSCTNQVYGVLFTESLETNTAWTPVAWMRGNDGETIWTDTNRIGVAQVFYKIERLAPDADEDGDGMPNGFEVDNGLNLLDPDDAARDADGDGVDNLTEYLQGRDPTRGAVADTDQLVNLNVFTPLE